MTLEFKKIIVPILEWEGGYSDHKSDKGGPSNFGISFKFLKSIYPKATHETIRQLRESDARNIYYNHFYIVCRLNELSSLGFQYMLLDQVIHSGYRLPIKRFQRCINCGLNSESRELLKVDGIMGSKTESIANGFYFNYRQGFLYNFTYLFNNFLLETFSFYLKITVKESQRIFLRGFMNRIKHIRRNFKMLENLS